MIDQKAGILNAISKFSASKVAEQVTDSIINSGLENVTDETLIAAGASKTAAANIITALELHNVLSTIVVRKQREKKPSVAERYTAEKTIDERDEVAIKVVELRINSLGSKPLAWRRIRERLGLKNEQFHKVVRLSDGYRAAVIARITHLKQQEGGWEYNGKLDVLTGIDISDAEIMAAPQVVEEERDDVATIPQAENQTAA